jgi:two-component system, OmpR family, response regulator
LRVLRRILIVEDDPDIQEVTGLLLSEIGSLEVHACESAAEALQSAPAFAPDLILLDVMMPGLDGQGAFAAFSRMPETAATPVIFMTARVQAGEIQEYRRLGALGVIPKPFDPDTLAETIQGMWDRYQKACLKEARRDDLAALRKVYEADLPERLRAIEAAAASLRNFGWDGQVVTSVLEMAQRLAGSAAVYGFPEVSEAAMRVASLANANGSPRPGPGDPQGLLKLVAMLSTALQAVVDDRDRPLAPDSSLRL